MQRVDAGVKSVGRDARRERAVRDDRSSPLKSPRAAASTSDAFKFFLGSHLDRWAKLLAKLAVT